MNRALRIAPFAVLLALVTACSHGPPLDFAPDPALVAQIRSIQITPGYARACPGSVITASYEAVLADSTHIPFQRGYDEKHPPRLHISFLEFTSAEATGRSDGSWLPAPDPLISATTGFRLSAALKAKPGIRATVVVPPDYNCTPRTFAYEGETYGHVHAGENGPNVTVRIGHGRSPFYDKLIIVGIQVGQQAPFYELYDASSVQPADWLQIESRGGRGSTGGAGLQGGNAGPGAAGCPPQNGGNGGDGGPGGAGGPGGRGGPVMIVAPDDDPYMAGLITVRNPGGYGGAGGPGGPGGQAGKGGEGQTLADGRRCTNGADGVAGRRGVTGPTGSDGPHGPRPEIITVPNAQLFGPSIPAELAALLGGSHRGS
jgi:hypothetical protein